MPAEAVFHNNKMSDISTLASAMVEGEILMREGKTEEGLGGRIYDIYHGRTKALPFLLQYAFGVALIREESRPTNQPLTLFHGTSFDLGTPSPCDEPTMIRLLQQITAAGTWLPSERTETTVIR